jgi:uncharacterized membrane protein YqhA
MLARLRYVTIVSVVFSFVGSLLMLYLGAAKIIQACRIYFFQQPIADGAPAYLDYSERTMIAVVESIDAFLIALVLIIFSAGVYTLFIGELSGLGRDGRWAWMRIGNVERLKQVLVELILVVLAVLFLRLALWEAEQLQWELLILPAGIALLAAALKLVGWRTEKH